MSVSEVDEKVVSLVFNNANFEKNVKTSMSTLEKLKSAFKFKGATEGISNIGKSINNISFSPISRGLQEVHNQFSALEIAGITAISNITNSVLNMGKQIATAITVEPVFTGLQEYETQMNAIQTILSNTKSQGTTLDDVTRALDELNLYADKTIYNFTEMTRNIGRFTAAGVDLKTSVAAIKGIANLAAISGSTSYQATNAMYQLSQALATGSVKLIDWNSVVNANMGGKVFQDALVETARVHGAIDEMGTTIDEWIEKQGSFRESLKNGWLTSEILTETLAKFTGELTREQILSIGYTEEQADAILELGRDANEAATKVKTFTQLIETLEEALQSGWAQTWQLIVGDFETARNLLSEIAAFFDEMFRESADKRNNLLEGAIKGTGWTKLEEQITSTGLTIEDFQNASREVLKSHGKDLDALITEYGSFEASLSSWLTGDIFKEICDNAEEGASSAAMSLEELQEMIDRVWTGEFGNGEDRRRALEELGYNYDLIQNALDYEYANGTKDLSQFSDEQLKSLGYTEEQIAAWRELGEAAADADSELNKAIEDLQKPTGRDLIHESVVNLLNFIKKTKETFDNAWKTIFGVTTSEQIYTVIERIRDFTAALMADPTKFKSFQAFLDGVFSVVKLGTDGLSSFVTWFIDLVKVIKDASGISINDTFMKLGLFLMSIDDFFVNNGIIGFIKDLGEVIKVLSAGGVKAIKNFFNSFISSEEGASKLQKFWDVLSKIYEEGSKFFGTISRLFEVVKNKINSFGDDITIDQFISVVEIILKSIWTLLGIYGSKVVNYISGIISNILSVITDFIDGFLGSFGISIKDNPIVNFFRDIKNAAKESGLTSIFGEFSVPIDEFITSVSERFNALIEVINNLGENLSAGNIGASIGAFVQDFASLVSNLFGSLLEVVTNNEGVNNIVEGFNNITSSIVLGIYAAVSEVLGAFGFLSSLFQPQEEKVVDFLSSSTTEVYDSANETVEEIGTKSEELVSTAEKTNKKIEEADSKVKEVETNLSTFGKDNAFNKASSNLEGMANQLSDSFSTLNDTLDTGEKGIDFNPNDDDIVYLNVSTADAYASANDTMDEVITYSSELVIGASTASEKIEEADEKVTEVGSKLSTFGKNGNFDKATSNLEDFGSKYSDVFPTLKGSVKNNEEYMNPIKESINKTHVALKGIKEEAEKVVSVSEESSSILGTMGENLKSTFSNLWDWIKKINIFGVASVVALIYMIDLFSDISHGIAGFGEVIEGIGKGVKNAGRYMVLRGLAELFIDIGLALVAMSVAAVIISAIPKENIDQALFTIASFFFLIAAFVWGMSSLKLEPIIIQLNLSALSLAAIVFAIQSLMGTMALISAIPTENMTNAVNALTAISFYLGMFLIGIAVISKMGIGLVKTAPTLFSIAGAMLLIASVVALLGHMKKETFDAGMEKLAYMAIGFLAFSALIAGMTPVTTAIGKNILLLSIALIVMISAIKLIEHFGLELEESSDKMKGVFGTLIAIFAVILGYLYVLAAITQNVSRKIAVVSGSFIGLSIFMMTLVTSLHLLSMLDEDQVNRGGQAVVMFMTMIAVLVAACSQIREGGLKGTTGLFISLAATLAILVIVIGLFGSMPEDMLDRGSKSVILLIAMISLLVYAAGQAMWLDSARFLGLNMCLVILMAGVALLSMLPVSEGKLLAAAGALSIVIICMSFLIKLTEMTIGMHIGTAGQIIGLMAIVIAIGGALAVLATQDWKSILASAVAMNATLFILVVLVTSLGGLGALAVTGAAALVMISIAMGIFSVAAIGFAYAMSLLSSIDGEALFKVFQKVAQGAIELCEALFAMIGVAIGITVLSVGLAVAAVGLALFAGGAALASLAITALASAFELACTSISNGLNTLHNLDITVSDMIAIGSFIAAGITIGIMAASGGPVGAMIALGAAIIAAFVGIMGIHSPSLPMQLLSYFIPEGIKEGILGNEDTVTGAVKHIGENMLGTLGETLPEFSLFGKDAMNALGESFNIESFEGRALLNNKDNILGALTVNDQDKNRLFSYNRQFANKYSKSFNGLGNIDLSGLDMSNLDLSQYGVDNIDLGDLGIDSTNLVSEAEDTGKEINEHFLAAVSKDILNKLAHGKITPNELLIAMGITPPENGMSMQEVWDTFQWYLENQPEVILNAADNLKITGLKELSEDAINNFVAFMEENDIPVSFAYELAGKPYTGFETYEDLRKQLIESANAGTLTLEDAYNFFDDIIEKAGLATEACKTAEEGLENLKKKADEVIAGKYGNGEENRKQQLMDEGFSEEEAGFIQEIVNVKLTSGDASEAMTALNTRIEEFYRKTSRTNDTSGYTDGVEDIIKVIGNYESVIKTARLESDNPLYSDNKPLIDEQSVVLLEGRVNRIVNAKEQLEEAVNNEPESSTGNTSNRIVPTSIIGRGSVLLDTALKNAEASGKVGREALDYAFRQIAISQGIDVSETNNLLTETDKLIRENQQLVDQFNSYDLSTEEGQKEYVNAYFDLMEKKSNEYTQGIFSTIIDWLTGNNMYEDVGGSHFASEYKGITDNMPTIDMDEVGEVATHVSGVFVATKAYADETEEAVESANEAVENLSETVDNVNQINLSNLQVDTGNLPMYKGRTEEGAKAGSDYTSSFASGVKNNASVVKQSGEQVTEQGLSAINSKAKDFEASGGKLITSAASGMSSKSGVVTSVVKGIGTMASNALVSLRDSFYLNGSNATMGFVNGLISKMDTVITTVQLMAQTANNTLTSNLDINSPSRLWRKYGTYTGDGLIIGMRSTISGITEASTAMGDSASEPIYNAMSKLEATDFSGLTNHIESALMSLNNFNYDDIVEVNPTIRPVLDLTDIESKSATIGSYFSNPKLSISGIDNLGSSIGNNQNGSEILSALNDLKASLGSPVMNTYNVNGITYDDGSNVARAIEEIVNATIMERRM